MFLTVGLPIFKQKDVAWLALEGLARQEGARCEWELIVCEEQDEALGEDGLQEYRQRLAASGCVNTLYIGIDSWVPLSQKWRMIVQAADLRSDWFLLQGADDYPQKYRLRNTARMADSGADWTTSIAGSFLGLVSGRSVIWKRPANSKNIKLGLDKAVRMPLVRTLPLSDQASSVDHWLYSETESVADKPIEVAWDDSQDWRFGLFTDGVNHISYRELHFALLSPPFYKPDGDVLALLPSDVIVRIRSYMDALTNRPYPLRQWGNDVPAFKGMLIE